MKPLHLQAETVLPLELTTRWVAPRDGRVVVSTWRLLVIGGVPAIEGRTSCRPGVAEIQTYWLDEAERRMSHLGGSAEVIAEARAMYDLIRTDRWRPSDGASP